MTDTSDLVERLRVLAENAISQYRPAFAEAADAIERLDAENYALKRINQDYAPERIKEALAAKDAEDELSRISSAGKLDISGLVERLRDAGLRDGFAIILHQYVAEAADAIERLVEGEAGNIKMIHKLADEIDKRDAALAAKDAEIARAALEGKP